MPWYRLAFTPEFVSDLSPLDKELAQRVFDKSKWLASNVANLRHEPIAPDLSTVAKYAVGEWRIFYSIDRTDHVLTVLGLIHKTELT